MIQTSPILEDAPVMSTTFPYTFSQSMDLFKKEINLSKYGGIKKVKAMIIKRGSAMFKNSSSKSITLLQ